MSTNVVAYLGPARSGKTRELIRAYREVLRQGGVSRALWLAPNARTAVAVRRQLLTRGFDACLAPGVVTFDQLTQTLLAGARPRRRYVSRTQQREVLRRVVRTAVEAGRLTLFAAAAERAGFIDLLAEHVQELARRDISPRAYRNAQPPRGDDGLHAELAHLHAEYVRQLAEHGLVDIETAHLVARDNLAARDARADGALPRLENLELVVVDGFTDFTRTQHDILRQLAQFAKQLLISLPTDAATRPPLRTGRFSDQSTGAQPPAAFPEPPRPDRLAKPAATLAELRRHHPRLELRQFAPRPSDWPALGHLTQNIFGQPGRIPSPSAVVLDSLDRLEIIEAAGADDEISQIACRIKQLLIPLPRREGLGEGSSAHNMAAASAARPADIAVVFRSLADVAPRVREVFDRFGIPYFIESGPRLLAAPLVKSLLDLLHLDAEDWPFRSVVGVVTNHSLTAVDATARQAADWLVRDLQIAKGRQKLLDRVEQLASDTNAQGEYVERRVAKAKAAQPTLKSLAAALDSLPQSATPTEWCQALAQAAAALGLPPFCGGLHAQTPGVPPSPPDRTDGRSDESLDLAAWQSIERHFAALERLDAWLSQPPRSWSRRDMLQALRDVATHESLPCAHDEVGRVQVLSAPAARNITARHLFLAGMSEQAFPMRERAGRLASEADYRHAARVADQELAAASAELPTRSQEEMLLFYEVLSRGEESLTISYPALDDKAQSLPPSPYVVEIERLLGEEGLQRIRRTTPRLSPVPRESGGYCLADWRVTAVAQALANDRALLAGLFSEGLPSLVAAGDSPRNGSGRVRVTLPPAAALDAGIRTVHARARREYGPGEGLLTSPAVAARLAERFGPQHLWSPSQWETYAACPYRFFQQDVLRLEPLGDLVLETDLARRGSRLHDVLAAFHRQWPAVRGSRPPADGEESAAFLAHLRKVIDERIAAGPRTGMDVALLELDRRQIQKWAANHFDHHVKYGGAFSQLGEALEPKHFEFRFGPPRGGDTDADPSSTHEAFLLDLDGEPIRVTGQIDRIDVITLGGKTFFTVIDYKSGKKITLKSEHIESGEKLQLPLYVEAAQALLFGGDATPLAAGYWSATGGFDAKGALAVVAQAEDGECWENTRAAVRRSVRRFIDAIRRGEFPVASRDDQCTSYCDFHTVCRIRQIRSLGKVWPPETENQL